MKFTVIWLSTVLFTGLTSLWAGEKTERDFAAMSQEQVRKYELDVMRRIADFALIPPKLNASPLPQYDYDQLDYGMTIGIERTPKGRLWACWVAGGDSPKAFFVLATSDDDGETWSKPRLVVDAHSKSLPMDRSVLVGTLWTDALGRLWLIFDQSMDMFDGRAGVWVSICENPDAAQPAWSPPRRIWHGVTLNKPTVLSTGEWMLPISLDQREGFGPFKGLFKELDPFRGANVFVSKDKGATWERRGAAKFPNPDWHEHMIVERKDKSLWMLARTRTGIMQSISTDGGRTWVEPTEPPGIRQPNARFHIRRLASGKLLLVKHGDRIDQHEGRVQLSAWLSDDDGKSWKGGLVLDERKGVSYPDGFQAPNGTIYISYDRNRATDGEILLARFTEEDISAKKLLGPKSKLKMLISRPLGIKKEKKTVSVQPAGVFASNLTAVAQERRLPKVVLLGDSIRMGYAPLVEKLLAGKAIIVSPKANGGDSANNLKNLEAWAIREQPDIVHFNCGIHDVKKSKKTGEHQVPAPQYEGNLRKIVERLRKETKATVIFVTTTPILDERAAKGRTKADYELLDASAIQYNGIARRVMQELKVPLNDLRDVMPDAGTREKLISADGVHFTQEGREKLAKAVADMISRHLPK